MIRLRSPGMEVALSPTGARILSCVVDGVETSFGSADEMQLRAGDIYAGAICGRHAGRITNASYVLDGAAVRLAANAGPHQLHGGADGFHQRHWDYLQDGNRVTFYLQSADGDQGFPGHLSVQAVYALAGSTLSLEITARTSQPTVCNLTNHGYWNLAGGGSVLGHELTILGARYFPLDDALMPTGRLEPVAGTDWDFRKARAIGRDYDGCILLDGARGDMKPALRLRDPASGRQLDVWASEGCMQFYTAIHWSAALSGHTGPLQRSAALAIEPQNIADAPNHAHFPSSILRPGEVYRNAMQWRFS